ncbi:MAG: DUF4266 domain-containing protein [Cellvibrionaceae bacterium]|nr:DUF4266 domain-containing protein [Cellvibrionaceae bacterium]
MLRLSLLILLLFISGCSPLKPWVKAHERELLSSPIMSLERDPISTRYINHVYESREAARGAEGSSGGGCGCN